MGIYQGRHNTPYVPPALLKVPLTFLPPLSPQPTLPPSTAPTVVTDRVALNRTNGKDYSENPSFTADGTAYYLISWVCPPSSPVWTTLTNSTHTPSEHKISGTSYPAELHLVHGTSSGTAAGVIGIPLTISSTSSAFFEQFLSSIPSTTSDSHAELDEVDMSLVLSGVGDLESYWTYKGSLTTPACTEGLRYGFSSKGVQKINAHALSV
ncbi:carbonic anhydrase [Acephala macrosclerotiorum]|nr:carbonic anhydrase [Acephala macrosclerotiorum]